MTYVTNQQLGFDYLRDQMAALPEDLRLRQDPFNCAIVDEADSVLIDEGRTPLVVSAQQEVPSEKYSTALEIATHLVRDQDYTVLEKEKTCTLTELGEDKTSRSLQISDLYDPNDPWAPYVVNALTAKELYVRDKQYLVTKDQTVVVVDEFTGRPVEGRSWSDGLQQAIEAKEGVEVSKDLRESWVPKGMTKTMRWDEQTEMFTKTYKNTSNNNEHFKVQQWGLAVIGRHRRAIVLSF